MDHKEYVKNRLSEAGKVLMMLPSSGLKPVSFGSGWPEIVLNQSEAYGYHKTDKTSVRPNLRQVTEFEEVMDWLVELAKYCQERQIPYVAKVIQLRLPHHPDSYRPKNSWTKIGKIMGKNERTIRRWHEDGIDIIARKIFGESEKNNLPVMSGNDRF